MHSSNSNSKVQLRAWWRWKPFQYLNTQFSSIWNEHHLILSVLLLLWLQYCLVGLLMKSTCFSLLSHRVDPLHPLQKIPLYMTVYFGHKQAKIHHSQLTMTIAKNVMYPASYICWTELNRHRLAFVSVMN